MLSRSASRLSALNPMSVLSRGYSAIFSDKNTCLTTAKSLNVGDRVNLRMKDGNIKATVNEIDLISEKGGQN